MPAILSHWCTNRANKLAAHSYAGIKGHLHFSNVFSISWSPDLSNCTKVHFPWFEGSVKTRRTEEERLFMIRLNIRQSQAENSSTVRMNLGVYQLIYICFFSPFLFILLSFLLFLEILQPWRDWKARRGEEGRSRSFSGVLESSVPCEKLQTEPLKLCTEEWLVLFQPWWHVTARHFQLDVELLERLFQLLLVPCIVRSYCIVEEDELVVQNLHLMTDEKRDENTRDWNPEGWL